MSWDQVYLTVTRKEHVFARLDLTEQSVIIVLKGFMVFQNVKVG